ncbi:MAG: PLP-dependent aminotransferase family protein [Chloroflexota bacterium]|nr:PLP-dependent aminotransferase family protein [Chloroflexota bacterium]
MAATASTTASGTAQPGGTQLAPAAAPAPAAVEFNFSTGMPDPKTFPSETLGAAAQRVILREGPSLVRYPDPRGYVPLREIAAQRFRHNHAVDVPIADVTLTTGSMQAIILATQAFVKAGDTVVVEEFCYSGTLGVLRQYGAHIAGVPLDDQGLRPDALEEVLDRLAAEGRRVAFVYSIATHQNPSGTILPLERRDALLSICKRRGVLVVEDDCYADVVFEGEMPPAIYTRGDPGAVLYIGSFSKILGPGARLGYFIAPDTLTEKMMAFKRDGGTSALSAMIVAEYLKDHLWSHIGEVCDAVRAKRDVLFAALGNELGGLVDWTRPHGGLFSWVKLPEGIDTQAIARLAKERGVQFGSGRSFDAADRDVPYLRLAFGFIDESLIPEGIARLGACIEGAAPGSVSRPRVPSSA